jgi:hypothetical protein
LAVGVVLAVLIGYTLCLLRRRQRRKLNEHTHASIKWPPAADHGVSFLDLPDDPPMRTISIDVRKKPSVVWGPRPRFPEETSFKGPSRPVSAYTPNEPRGVGLAAIGAGGILADVGPFSDLHAAPEREESTTGLAITTGQEVVRTRTSFTPSSPSLYSESMKSVNEDADSLYEREMGISTQDGSIETSHVSEYANGPSPPTYISSRSLLTTFHTEIPIESRFEGPKIPQL